MSTYFNVETEVRKVLPNPSSFGAYKGYWIARSRDGKPAFEGNAELTLAIQFVEKTLKEAEERALQIGVRFGSLTSAFGGYPLASPRLQRIATVDTEERLVSQHNYLYDDRLYLTQGASFDTTVQNEYQRFLSFFSSYDDKNQYRLQSAIHWYGIAISADDPAVAYVAAWTGLECIGPLMDSRFHPQGSRVACHTCGNEAGSKRDDTMAGIEHVFNSGTLDPACGFTFEKAHQLRHDLVHGLRDIELLVQECSDFGRFLVDILNVSVLTALTPEEYGDQNSVLSLRAGDHGFRPTSRLSILFNGGQTLPYMGDWTECRLIREPRTGTQGQGNPDVSVEVETGWILENDQRNAVISFSYEEFRRLDQEEDPMEGREMPVFLPWRDRPLEPTWKSASELGWESLTEGVR